MPETLLEMPQLMRSGSLTVSLLLRGEHPRPHVHAYYQTRRVNASIQIDNQRVTEQSDNFPPRQLRDAVAWVGLNKDVLDKLWTTYETKDKLTPQQLNQKIAALKRQLKPLPKRGRRQGRVLKERLIEKLKALPPRKSAVAARLIQERLAALRK